ncbi:DUF2330 domain-containing protein [Kribbella qitaiheensis]|uniref:DUF2330 domain-containing protein n=1 Tax=Kribbella qitaiheensis TaxID=1544730 RepID=A0A7G6WRP2_9ACTN|nr:DUF2330 domain-containing protein [Kribbella qitaiheensis]QNE16657.1 DUF2330 domain-containing protein [Kribbella qitaiheensis]
MKLWRMVAGVLGFAAVAVGVTPAWACACGGYLADAESRARVFGENALVRFDGGREEIVLSMNVHGSSKKAAWIMPVPAAAEVSLGEPYTFERLASLTAPKVVVRKTYWPFRDLGIMAGGRDGSVGAAPGAGAGVDVRQQMTLGPFQVVRLGGTSATAVTNWLKVNGYAVPATLATNLTPYITEKWEIVAVKLAPKEVTGSLSGVTPPLQLSFASSRIVYPMRLSKGATMEQTVTVYVASSHRVDASQLPDPSVQPKLLYAGQLTDEPELTGSQHYLTAYSVTYANPSRITNDFAFTQAPNDAEFQRVTYRTENHPWLSTIGILLGIPLLIGVGAALIARRSVRRSARRT